MRQVCLLSFCLFSWTASNICFSYKSTFSLQWFCVYLSKHALAYVYVWACLWMFMNDGRAQIGCRDRMRSYIWMSSTQHPQLPHAADSDVFLSIRTEMAPRNDLVCPVGVIFSSAVPNRLFLLPVCTNLAPRAWCHHSTRGNLNSSFCPQMQCYEILQEREVKRWCSKDMKQSALIRLK